MKKWEYIIVHHSLTKDGNTVSWQAIRKYHKDILKWADIGYHFGIEIINGEIEILFGRSLLKDGAHTKELGMNQKGIGVCIIGNFDLVAPDGAALLKLKELIKFLKDVYEIETDNILGHREVGIRAGYDWIRKEYKSCPGEQFNMDMLRGEIKRGW